MRVLRPGIAREAARRRLRAGQLRAWLRGEEALRLELVYLPHHQLDVALGEREERVTALLDAAGGLFSVLVSSTPLASEPPEAGAEILPVLIDAASAARQLRDGLAEAALRQARRNGRSTPTALRPLASGVVAFPFWIQHVRRRGKLDFRAIDGLTGEPVGVRMRRSLVVAFVRASELCPQAAPALRASAQGS